MYQEEYKRWLAADLEDADLKPELSKIEGNDDEIKERFAVPCYIFHVYIRSVIREIQAILLFETLVFLIPFQYLFG